MKVLCTGGGGFIGSHTVDLLQARGHEVCVVDDFSTGNIQNLTGFMEKKGRVENIDIRNELEIAWLFDSFKPDAVIHLAAQSAISTAWKNPKKDLRINAVGTLNLIDMAVQYEITRFVFSSTSAVYREYRYFPIRTSEETRTLPNTPYGISKLAAEHYLMAMLPFSHRILRYGNVYGPRQVSIGENQVVARALDHILNGKEFSIVGDGKQTRDYVYVGDVAMANVMAVESETLLGVYNCASGISHSVNEVVEAVNKALDIEYNWLHSPKNDPRRRVKMNVKKIQNRLGWKAKTTLEEGIRLTVDWWKEKK